jgi:hypothetical protein
VLILKVVAEKFRSGGKRRRKSGNSETDSKSGKWKKGDRHRRTRKSGKTFSKARV